MGMLRAAGRRPAVAFGPASTLSPRRPPARSRPGLASARAKKSRHRRAAAETEWRLLMGSAPSMHDAERPPLRHGGQAGPSASLTVTPGPGDALVPGQPVGPGLELAGDSGAPIRCRDRGRDTRTWSAPALGPRRQVHPALFGRCGGAGGHRVHHPHRPLALRSADRTASRVHLGRRR